MNFRQEIQSSDFQSSIKYSSKRKGAKIYVSYLKTPTKVRWVEVRKRIVVDGILHVLDESTLTYRPTEPVPPPRPTSPCYEPTSPAYPPRSSTPPPTPPPTTPLLHGPSQAGDNSKFLADWLEPPPLPFNNNDRDGWEWPRGVPFNYSSPNAPGRFQIPVDPVPPPVPSHVVVPTAVTSGDIVEI